MYLLVNLLWLALLFFEKTKIKQKLTAPTFPAAHSDLSLEPAVHLPLACSVVIPFSSVFWPRAIRTIWARCFPALSHVGSCGSGPHSQWGEGWRAEKRHRGKWKSSVFTQIVATDYSPDKKTQLLLLTACQARLPLASFLYLLQYKCLVGLQGGRTLLPAPQSLSNIQLSPAQSALRVAQSLLNSSLPEGSGCCCAHTSAKAV